MTAENFLNGILRGGLHALHDACPCACHLLFHGFDCTLTVGLCKVRHGVFQACLLRPVAMLAKALQVEQLIATSVLLRNNVIDVDICFPNLFPTPRASVPTVIRFVVLEPFVSVAHLYHQLFFFGRRGAPADQRRWFSTTPHPLGWFDATLQNSCLTR